MRTNSPLKQARINRGWNRPQVIVKAESHFSMASLERWEDESCKNIREDNVAILCQLYGLTPEQLGLGENHAIIGVATVPIVAEETSMSSFMRRALFSSLGSRLTSLIDVWPRRDYAYQELQGEINQAIVEYNVVATESDAYERTRRQALEDMILVPVQLMSGIALLSEGKRQKADTDILLKHIAAGITALWYMRRGKDLTFVNESISEYIRILSPLMYSQSFTYRKAGATLLSQSFRLKGEIVRHLKNGDSAMPYYQEALNYAQGAENQTEQAIANRMMAFAYKSTGKTGYKQALSCAQAAYELMTPDMPGIVRSFIASGLSLMRATNGQTSDAKVSLHEASDLFDPCTLVPSVHYTESNLLAIGASVERHCGNFEEATHLLTKSLRLPTISTLGSIQGRIEYAEMEVSRDDKQRDMGLAVDMLTEAVIGAKELDSAAYKEEASKLYDLFRIVWPREETVKKLGREHFGM
jgi:tetratricopeptide (TPR) repeat protein